MRTRSIVFLFALAMLVPLMASADGRVAQPRADRGRIGVTRQQIADWLNQNAVFPPNASFRYKASDIRIRTRVDKKHGDDGHVHIMGHTPRLVSWSVKSIPGLKGKALSDTPIGGGKGTTVTNMKVSKVPWSLPSESPTESPAQSPAQSQ